MLVVETQVEQGWPTTVDWVALADDACRAALAETPHGWLDQESFAVEVSVRLTSDAEVHSLNAHYRDKDRPTNVLSFPMVQPDLIEGLSNSDDGEILLGDIVLAAGVCAAEAADKKVAIETHATHLVVHGLLHLLGFDHEQGEAEAEAMEAIERVALARLGISDPYAVSES